MSSGIRFDISDLEEAAPDEICDGLAEYLKKMKVDRLSDLVGTLQLPGDQPATAPYP